MLRSVNYVGQSINYKTITLNSYDSAGNNSVIIKLSKNNHYRGILELAGGYNRGIYLGLNTYSLIYDSWSSVNVISNGFYPEATGTISVVPTSEGIRITLIPKEVIVTFGITYRSLDNYAGDIKITDIIPEHIDDTNPNNDTIINMRDDRWYYKTSTDKWMSITKYGSNPFKITYLGCLGVHITKNYFQKEMTGTLKGNPFDYKAICVYGSDNTVDEVNSAVSTRDYFVCTPIDTQILPIGDNSYAVECVLWGTDYNDNAGSGGNGTCCFRVFIQKPNKIKAILTKYINEMSIDDRENSIVVYGIGEKKLHSFYLLNNIISSPLYKYNKGGVIIC